MGSGTTCSRLPDVHGCPGQRRDRRLVPVQLSDLLPIVAVQVPPAHTHGRPTEPWGHREGADPRQIRPRAILRCVGHGQRTTHGGSTWITPSTRLRPLPIKVCTTGNKFQVTSQKSVAEVLPQIRNLKARGTLHSPKHPSIKIKAPSKKQGPPLPLFLTLRPQIADRTGRRSTKGSTHAARSTRSVSVSQSKLPIILQLNCCTQLYCYYDTS